MKYRFEELSQLGFIALEHIEDIFDSLAIEYEIEGTSIYACCPIHGGDNFSGFRMYIANENIPGVWRCFTQNCHLKYTHDIYGFVHGVLSTRDHLTKFDDAVSYVLQFLSADEKKVTVNTIDSEKLQFSRQINRITKTANRSSSNITRQEIRRSLDIPADYFLNRGFSADTLNRYDVGVCSKPNKPMSGRVVIPIYDDNYRFMVGCTGRTLHKQCPKCKFYHNESRHCPEKKYAFDFYKWKHSKGFEGEAYLYNYWFAQDYIKETGNVIIVESPGNVWRLEENDVKGSLGTFGAHLTEQQIMILQCSGALKVTLLLDNDQAGHSASEQIKNRLNRLFNVVIPKIEWNGYNDIGDMSNSTFQEIILPHLGV